MLEKQDNADHSNDLAFVQSFKEGQAVPEWLLAMEPTTPTSIRGEFIFATDADLYSKNDRYWLLPSDPAKMVHMFRLIGARDCNLMAGSQQISYPSQIITARIDGAGRNVVLG